MRPGLDEVGFAPGSAPNHDQETDMAISAHFQHRGFTPEKYDETIRRLEAAGHGKPAQDPFTSPSRRTAKSRCSTSGSPPRLSKHSVQLSCPFSRSSASSFTHRPFTLSATRSWPDPTLPVSISADRRPAERRQLRLFVMSTNSSPTARACGAPVSL